MQGPLEHRAAIVVAAVAAIYTVAHFGASGISMALNRPNIGQIQEEIPPLLVYLREGGPIDSHNPRQYGPVFFFVMHPLLRFVGDEPARLSRWLYGLELACLAGAFFFTWATLTRLWQPAMRPLALACLAFLWLNFAPMYTILAVKNVEGWELLLISAALYAYLRGRTWSAAFAVAAAGLIKLLPFAFLCYFALRDRRAFAKACAAVCVLLLAGHVLYGAGFGALYLPRVARSAVGNSFALGWHENISAKGMIAKAFGHLETEPSPLPDSEIDVTLNAQTGAGQPGYNVVLTRRRLAAVRILGQGVQLAGVLWLAWVCTRASTRTPERTVWEWSLVATMMLILSPQTAFEYCTLILGAFSYVLVRLLADGAARPRVAAWVTFGMATLLVANIAPRQVVNRLLLVDAINTWTGYTHLRASEAYQYYGFPFAGMLLLVVTLWQLRPTREAVLIPIAAPAPAC